MKAKSKLHNGVGFNAEFVARGEIDLAIQQISEIVFGERRRACRPAASRPTAHDRVRNRHWRRLPRTQGAAKEFVKFLTLPAAAAGDQGDRHGTRSDVSGLSPQCGRVNVRVGWSSASDSRCPRDVGLYSNSGNIAALPQAVERGQIETSRRTITDFRSAASEVFTRCSLPHR